MTQAVQNLWNRRFERNASISMLMHRGENMEAEFKFVNSVVFKTFKTMNRIIKNKRYFKKYFKNLFDFAVYSCIF